MDEYAWAPGERGFSVVVTMTVLAAVLWPLRQHLRPPVERVDGFPLSYYPMFSLRRRRHGGITYVVAVAADGSRRYLRHGLLGPAGLNQVRRQLYRTAVREGRAGSCARTVAARIAGHRECADIVRVEVVRGRFDLDSCLLSRQVRARETVLAAAEVPW